MLKTTVEFLVSLLLVLRNIMLRRHYIHDEPSLAETNTLEGASLPIYAIYFNQIG